MLTLAEACWMDSIRSTDVIPVIAIIGGMAVGAIWIIGAFIKSMVVGVARERTKRELAAYVAEGSMKPETAIELAKAGKTDDEDM